MTTMTFREWINDIMDNGMLCSNYTDRVNGALGKKQLMDIVLDANGMSYLQEMQQNGFPLPYETILREFNRFINGRYIYESIPNEKGYTYTTAIYCCYNDDDHIDVETTAISLLGCKTKLNITKLLATSVYLDSNCEVDIVCPEDTTCSVYKYGNAKVNNVEGEGKVRIIHVK